MLINLDTRRRRVLGSIIVICNLNSNVFIRQKPLCNHEPGIVVGLRQNLMCIANNQLLNTFLLIFNSHHLQRQTSIGFNHTIIQEQRRDSVLPGRDDKPTHVRTPEEKPSVCVPTRGLVTVRSMGTMPCSEPVIATHCDRHIAVFPHRLSSQG